jgi:hypothetical protein
VSISHEPAGLWTSKELAKARQGLRAVESWTWGSFPRAPASRLLVKRTWESPGVSLSTTSKSEKMYDSRKKPRGGRGL